MVYLPYLALAIPSLLPLPEQWEKGGGSGEETRIFNEFTTSHPPKFTFLTSEGKAQTIGGGIPSFPFNYHPIP